MLDAEAKTSYVNKRMAEMLGYSVQEMTGCSLFEFMDDTGRVEAENLFNRRKKGIKEQHDFRFRRKDGSYLWTLVSGNPVFDDSGKMTGVLGMITDITERKRAEEMMKEKARAELYGFIVSALPVFAAGVPSQVRNTLVKSFGERFEKNIMPRFREEMRRLDDGRKNRGKDSMPDELDRFILWLSGLFSNLGIRTRTAPEGYENFFELLNCPWKGEASGNPVFCFICRTVVIRSFTWTSLKGSIGQESSIANDSQTCRFKIHAISVRKTINTD